MLLIPCPAKVNLFLAVGPPDERGYHPIRTVFQAIGLWDRLSLEIASEDSITSNWAGLPADNTVAKALRLVRELLPVPPLRIHLEKAIPDQTGLGGGSSDAAGLLRGIPFMLPGVCDPAFLMDVAAAVGKDVPFFLMGGRARGEGYGERLTPLPDPEPDWIVVVRPEVGCPTPEAYRRLDEQPRPFLEFPNDRELYNDFERVAPEESLELIGRLGAFGAEAALLCGSGSGVFGVFPNEQEARQAERRFAEDHRVRAWTAPFLGRADSLRVETL